LGQPTFTPHLDANELVINNLLAFLLAVVFDQGIPAERAWRASYELMQRLGHLDSARMVADPEGVRAAVGQPPVFHRYRAKMPGWLVAAARIVLEYFHGDAARIWSKSRPPGNHISARTGSPASARRRRRWQWRSWSATSAYPCGTVWQRHRVRRPRPSFLPQIRPGRIRRSRPHGRRRAPRLPEDHARSISTPGSFVVSGATPGYPTVQHARSSPCVRRKSAGPARYAAPNERPCRSRGRRGVTIERRGGCRADCL